MPVQRSFEEFHKSTAKELSVAQDRIRNLIGAAHWLTDGEHREAVLRKVLRNHIPESFHVGKGFVSFKDGTSNQTDVLITHRDHPTLFKDGDLRIVTPDAVRGIVEVKKSVPSEAKLEEYLEKLADNAERIRKFYKPISWCWAGLFVFNDEDDPDKHTFGHEVILEAIARAARRKKNRAINSIAMGPNDFFRFLEKGADVSSRVDGAVWHSYRLENLAFSYFIGNIVVDYLSWERSFKSQYAWFPIEGGKETRRKYYISMRGMRSESF